MIPLMSYTITALIHEAWAPANWAARGKGCGQLLIEAPSLPLVSTSAQTGQIGGAPPFRLGSWEQRDYLKTETVTWALILLPVSQ